MYTLIYLSYGMCSALAKIISGGVYFLTNSLFQPSESENTPRWILWATFSTWPAVIFKSDNGRRGHNTWSRWHDLTKLRIFLFLYIKNMSIKWIIRNKYVPYLQTVINVNLHANALTSYYEILILASSILDLLKFVLLLFDFLWEILDTIKICYTVYMYVCTYVRM